MKKIDLHIHTNCSDGIYSPEQILEFAKDNFYDVISITDHDTLDGFKIAQKLIKNYEFYLIPGVEISSLHKDIDVHLLAYNFDPENRELIDLLHFIHKGRFVRAKKILKKLKFMGINIDFERVRQIAGDNDLIGRPHIARALIETKHCSNMKEVFEIYLGEDCPAYVPKPAPKVKKVIKLIKKVGGISVLAHPYTLGDDRIIFDLIEMGLDGIEIFYSKHSKDKISYYNEIAQKNNLIRTGGSDFHGENSSDYFGDYNIPEFVYDEIMKSRKADE